MEQGQINGCRYKVASRIIVGRLGLAFRGFDKQSSICAVTIFMVDIVTSVELCMIIL